MTDRRAITKNNLDRALGFQQRKDALARLDIPGYSASIGARVVHRISVVPPHEALHEEFAEDTSVRVRLREAVANGELPRAYYDHAVVRRYPLGVVVPLSLYLDGTPYSKKDSVLGVFVNNLLSGRRHLICVLRKSNLCRCGCRGWCSIWPLMAMLHWSFAHLASGELPSSPCPGLFWDEYRDSLGGGALLLVACLLHIKLDWKEAAETMGFPSWGSHSFPCLWCNAERDSMHVLGASTELPFLLTTAADYERACGACEVVLRLLVWRHVLDIRAALVLSGFSGSGKGRYLKIGLPHLGLEKGDRIEPSHQCPDYEALFGLNDLPRGGVVLMFWRRARETRVRHRNPLFDAALGITPSILMGDVLHVLFLGVLQEYGAAAFEALVRSNYYGAPRHYTQDAVLEHTLTHFKVELKSWYGDWEARHPGQELTRVQDMSVTMVRSNGKPTFDLKAGETKAATLFWNEFHQAALPNGRLHQCELWASTSASIVDHISIMDANPWRLEHDQYMERLFSMQWKSFAEIQYPKWGRYFQTYKL